MSLLVWIPVQYRVVVGLVVAVLLMSAAGAAGWTANGLRMGKQLAEQGRDLERQLAERDRTHAAALLKVEQAAADSVLEEQGKRLALEDKLTQSSKTKHEELTNAQKESQLLRDRLATTDLRLSVLLDAGAVDQVCRTPTGSGAGGLVHAASRGQLDPAHAQRIISITNDGDQGLIALAACQEYALEVSSKR